MGFLPVALSVARRFITERLCDYGSFTPLPPPLHFVPARYTDHARISMVAQFIRFLVQLVGTTPSDHERGAFGQRSSDPFE